MTMETVSELSTDERVKAAAVHLFGAKGFAATGIRQIAQEAGISVASLYHYMATKEDLLLSLMLDGMNSLLEPARDVMAAGGPADPAERIRRLVDIHIQFHCTRAALARVTDAEIRALSGAAYQEVIDLRDTYEHMWLTTIKAGAQDGTFHVPAPRLTTFAILEMCTSVSHWFSPDGAYVVDEISDYYTALSLRILGYRKLSVIRRLEEVGPPRRARGGSGRLAR